MSEHVSQPKVFEFAKEIGMETLALMDKIREWKLPVRSHMAELEPDMVEAIRAKLSQGPGKEPARKKVVKRAPPVAVPASGPSNGTAIQKPANSNKAAAAGSAPKVAARKPTPGNGADEAPGAGLTVAGKVMVKKAVAKIVVRRKPDDPPEESPTEDSSGTAHLDGASEGTAAHESRSPGEDPAPAVAASTALESDSKPAFAASVVSAPIASIQEGVASGSESGHSAVEAQSQPMAPPKLTVAPSLAGTPHGPAASPESVPAALAVVPPVVPVSMSGPGQVQASASVPAPPPVAAGPVPGRKREVVMTAGGPNSGIRSEPRRNIVGRMDLSRVQPPPGMQRPGIGGAPRPGGATGATGAPRGLRTGFVSAAPVDLPSSDPGLERRRFDESSRKRPGAPGTASTAKEKEQEVVAFAATEFRKREMVFQPKKKKGMLNRASKQTQITKAKASKRIVKVNETMKVSDLAEAMGVKASQVTKKLIQSGVTATMNSQLDFETIALIAPEFNHEAVNVFRTVDQLISATAFGDLTKERMIRSPVVTVMGHVDHGKTSLLDAIRKADVVSGEAGGITQHIGAYRVTTDDGHVITFLDTPGHEAFTAMRARGANVTDIAVIVVAADDGVMPQTAEAINHAKAAKVPIIVAINKIDKPGANADKIKQQLTEFQLVPEEWGGDTIFVNTSAMQKTGIKELLEQIYALAEMGDLRANPERSATGAVIEARLDKGRGPVATLLIKDGTLRVGQPIVVGSVAGRVRSLINDKGERVQEAGPSMPVEVLGLSVVPVAGDQFDACEDEKAAERIAAARRTATLAAIVVPPMKMSLEDLFSKVKLGETKELAIVLKSDVSGSAEAIRGMLDKVGTSEVKIKVIHSAVGGINESDVLLASTAKGIVVGFNVRPDGGAQAMAKRENVELKTYTIVYEMMDDLKKAMSGLLTPEIKETQQGRAEVRNTFSVPKLGMIAGCAVVDGKFLRNSAVRLTRDGKIIYTGKLASLKRFKDDVKEVAMGYECGIGIENFNDIKVGDVIEAFTQESISREL